MAHLVYQIYKTIHLLFDFSVSPKWVLLSKKINKLVPFKPLVLFKSHKEQRAFYFAALMLS